MRDGFIDDGEIALLARQALDELGPNLDVRITPATDDDPYRRHARRWTVWPLIDGPARTFGIYVDGTVDPVLILAHLLDQLGEFGSETSRFWGVAFPPCPGHPYPATLSVDADDVVLTCPDTEREVRRITPLS